MVVTINTPSRRSNIVSIPALSPLVHFLFTPYTITDVFTIFDFIRHSVPNHIKLTFFF